MDDHNHLANDSLQTSSGESVAHSKVSLPPVHGDWPYIARLFQSHNWDASSAVHPSVCKAYEHLALLQECVHRVGAESLSSGSRVQSAAAAERKTLRFENDPDTTAVTSPQATALSVTGIGVKVVSVVPELTCEQLKVPFLGVEDVTDEVILLLSRLDADRLETTRRLEAQRRIHATLSDKINELSVCRLREMPGAVQREHERCARDILELVWFGSYHSRLESRLQDKVTAAEELKAKLTEDIADIAHRYPLIKEKLQLEVDGMKKIEMIQKDADVELAAIMEKFIRISSKSAEGFVKGEEERQIRKFDMLSCETELNKQTDKLEHAIDNHGKMTEKSAAYRVRISDLTQKLAELRVQEDEARIRDEEQEAKLKELNDTIVKTKKDYESLDDQVSAVNADIETQIAEFETADKEILAQLTKVQNELQLATRANNEIEFTIRNTKKKIHECDKQKSEDEKNVLRMEKDRVRTEKLITAITKELGEVSLLMDATNASAQLAGDNSQDEEDALKRMMEVLKNQIADETKQKSMLESSFEQDTAEHEKLEHEAQRKRASTDKKSGEVFKAVAIVRDKAKGLQDVHKEKLEEVQRLKDMMLAQRKVVNQVAYEARSSLITVGPQHDTMKAEVTETTTALEELTTKTENVRKELEDMEESMTYMEHAQVNTASMIGPLQEQLEELNKQLATALHIHEEMQKSMKEVTKRSDAQAKQHKNYLCDRNEVLVKHETQLAEQTKVNEQLASRYRQLQNQYLTEKKQLCMTQQDQVILETKLKDLKQQANMQSHMHVMLQEYYKYRGLHNSSELARVDSLSQQNAAEINRVQNNMNRALGEVTTYLQEQLAKMADSRAGREAGAVPVIKECSDVFMPK